MARYPDAKWRPLGTQTEARLTRRNKVVLHTMVGSLWGTDSYFRQSGYSGTESHFGVGYDGEVLQWQDTDYQADANLEGNDDCISIETADRGPGFPDWDTSGDHVPAWTDRQIEAIAQIVAWACKKYDIPCRLIPDTEDSTRGIGYHRQGIDPYRTHGEHYSESFGKVCPGDRRVAQVPRVIARANEILNGDEVTPEDIEKVAEAVWDRVNINGHTMGTVALNIFNRVQPDAIGESVWDRVNVDGHTMGTLAKWTEENARSARAVAEALQPLLVDLKAAVEAGGSITLTEEQVNQLAVSLSAIVGNGFADTVANKLHERLAA